jgi:hypothetical protein
VTELLISAASSRELSKLFFNAQHRIAVAAVFAPPKEVMLGYEEVASVAGVSRSVAHKELAVLVRIGAIARLEVGRAVGYQRLDGPFWPFVTDLIKRV